MRTHKPSCSACCRKNACVASVASETITIDVRVIAATHRDLETAMRESQFREDLYYRLSVAVITLPPLRDRREDIPELVRYFLLRYAREFVIAQAAIQPKALRWLRDQPWPGNVRELENAVRKVLLLARGFSIGMPDVRQALGNAPAPQASISALTQTSRNCSPPRKVGGIRMSVRSF